MSSIALPRAEPSRLTGLVVACLAATWLVWGSTYLAIKFALVGLPPFFQMGTRFLVAGAVLLPWAAWRQARLPSAREWRNAALVGTLMLGGGMGGTAYTEQSVGSGLVVAFIAVVPMLIAVVSLFFGVRPTRIEALGIAVGFGGVLMLTQGHGFQASPAGLVAIALSSTAWSVGSVLSQYRFRLAPGALGFSSEMLCGGAALLAASWLRGEHLASPVPASSLWAWAYLVVFGSLVAFNAYMVLLERAPAAVASSYTFVNPLIAMLLGVAIAGERVSTYEWAAVGVVLSGVALLMIRRR